VLHAFEKVEMKAAESTPGGKSHGGLVTKLAQTTDHADGDIREVRMVAKSLALMNIRQMDFDTRQRHTGQGIANCHAGMGISACVNHDEFSTIGTSRLNPVDQYAFVVALKRFDRHTQLRAQLDQAGIDLCERTVTIHLGLSRTQEVQVRAVQD